MPGKEAVVSDEARDKDLIFLLSAERGHNETLALKLPCVI